MKSKKKVDINTLVDLVVNTARADTTSPDPKNPRVGWQTDQLLIGMVDKLMTYQYNDPAGYAEIGRRALALSKPSEMSSEIAALLWFAVFRGERLLPVTAKRKAMLSDMVSDIRGKIDELPTGSRKERLASLLAYNEGVFYDAYEMFAQAAGMQRQSAEIAQANGDAAGAAIGLFLGVLYRLKQAMVEEKAYADEDRQAIFSTLEARFTELVDAVRGTPLEVSWGQGNAPCHMFQACVWLGKDRSDMEKWVAAVVSAAGSLKGVWGDIAKHYLAMNSFREGDGQAKTELEKVAAESGDATRKAEAILVLARRAIADGDRKLASKLVKKMPRKGASHLRAVAQRLLASATP